MEYLQYNNKENIANLESRVLNLVINGIPSILEVCSISSFFISSFKPCYKWNTFNTAGNVVEKEVLAQVLNLVINGIPSIQEECKMKINLDLSFKPCYKWNTFNTVSMDVIK